MTRIGVLLAVFGSLLTALGATAVLAIHFPAPMPGRLFAAGLSFVPLWVTLAFAGIGLKRARYRVAAFVLVNAACAASVALHWRALT